MTANSLAFSAAQVPGWCLQRPKPALQAVSDFVAAPLRMAMLPDAVNERLHLTSLRGERFAAVLPELRGRVLDIGAGDNALLRLYRERALQCGQSPEAAAASVGVDVEDWGGGCQIIEDAAKLPFEDQSFDTITLIACINHITNRDEVVRESRRLLRPGGRVVVTMINRFLGTIGHAIWWYSEDKHRHVEEEELMGMDRAEVIDLLRSNGFPDVEVKNFAYGMNRVYVAQ
jgi:SAM-dependent methyltransferase